MAVKARAVLVGERSAAEVAGAPEPVAANSAPRPMAPDDMVTLFCPPGAPMDEAVCDWCGRPYRVRRGGSPQRFCGAACRSAFHTAARRWAERAVAAGWLTLAELRRMATPEKRARCTEAAKTGE
jgi:hypothetical protein